MAWLPARKSGTEPADNPGAPPRPGEFAVDPSRRPSILWSQYGASLIL